MFMVGPSSTKNPNKERERWAIVEIGEKNGNYTVNSGYNLTSKLFVNGLINWNGMPSKRDMGVW